MKFLILGLACVVLAINGEVNEEYLPPSEDVSFLEPGGESITQFVEPIEHLNDDGYRYKTVKRLRHRRDVSELSPGQYLPPVEQSGYQYPAPAPAVQAPLLPPESAILGDDGYAYKTVKRIRYRTRRDVHELPSSEYIPPIEAPIIEPGLEYLAPEIDAAIDAAADDGYRYKTVKKLRHRHRRDVSELSGNGYSYPAPASTELSAPIHEPAGYSYPAPIHEIAAPAEIPLPSPSVELGHDGYRYKTVRRIRYKHRREAPAPDYLPPALGSGSPGYSYPHPAPPVVEHPLDIPASVEVSAPIPSAELADDGYRYKTVRRILYRHRRDVSELPLDYIPPEISDPHGQNPIAIVEPLADDGYLYKTIKRLRHRHRRDVSELLSASYLPPVEHHDLGYSYPAPVQELESPVELANDGYHYKTVKRLRLRHRRNVSGLLSGEYLPPGHVAPLLEPSNQYLAPELDIAQPLASDGYQYKTVKKFKIKRS